MFTGIIQAVGTINDLRKGTESLQLSINAPSVCAGSQRGDSISVNGVCLTVTEFSESEFHADVMQETLRASNLKSLSTGSHVNLERALQPNSLMGGHMVQGHVDATGVVKKLEMKDRFWWFEVSADEQILKYLLPKSSIAINGISLTVVGKTADSFSVSLIPTTYADTNIHDLRQGDLVNLEVDMMAKYVYHYLEAMNSKTEPKNNNKITAAFLAENGF